ncbi:hypothetical protein VTL71DRAFT_12386 [Oculimacula yallundae]|uniref:Uncharacterized protein n=1 Tax=Oculimacula yallundae TaxID=86028 RepID=A0ABR4CP23_9HELO
MSTRSALEVSWVGEEVSPNEVVRRDKAMEIHTLLHLEPVEREGLKRITQVPGVHWRDAVFAVPRAPDNPDPATVYELKSHEADDLAKHEKD